MRKKSVDVCLFGLMGMAHEFRIKLLMVIISLCFLSLSLFSAGIVKVKRATFFGQSLHSSFGV